MSVSRTLRFLTSHLTVRERQALCRRLRLPVTRTGDDAQRALREWLRSHQEIDFFNLLAKIPANQLLDWAREAGTRTRAKGVAIEAIAASLGLHHPDLTRAAADEDDEDGPPDPDEVQGFTYDPFRASQTAYPYQKKCLAALERATRTGDPGRHLIHIATGGGKTRVANDWVWQRVQEGKRILWVTKDWELLRQAASDLCGRFQGAGKVVGRVGGHKHLPHLPSKPASAVVYTTIHTWLKRSQRELKTLSFDFVVIDELHWGEGGRSYGRLMRRHKDKTFIGLTATPREWSSFQRVGRAYDFPYLVNEGHLARPVVHSSNSTGVHWYPERSGADGDFTPSSLGTLARSKKRNSLIVETYIKNRSRFGKTLVFACDIVHADRLAKLFQRQGVIAEALHSRLEQDDRLLVRERFQNGSTEVLVNVAMLTHGVDIPDIRTIFLARPTTSPTLFWQMIGRGSRKAPGKDTFFVLDFVDVVERYSDQTLRVKKELGERFPAHAPAASSKRGPVLKKWTFSPAKILRFPERPGYEEMEGLEFQPDQTFGIEFELTRKGFVPGLMPEDWGQVADKLLGSLQEALGSQYVARKPVTEYHGTKSLDVWNVEWDSSCGWEITTRILKGQAGLEEVHDACLGLQSVVAAEGLCVNFRTGTHVHLGWKPTAAKLHRLVGTAAHFEPALLSLVSPSRMQSQYCKPVREMLDRTEGLTRLDQWSQEFSDPSDRYYALNLRNLFDQYGTVEVRLHNGTQEPKKILTWLSLWMRIMEAVDRGRAPKAGGHMGVEMLPLCAGPQGDVTALADHVSAGDRLKEYLADRRSFVLENSWMTHSDYGELAREVAAGWA